jgi:hypothetical protein
MPTAPTKPTNREAADRWQCSIRTIQRARLLGVDVADPVAMAKHLVSLQNPSHRMLAAAQAELARL